MKSFAEYLAESNFRKIPLEDTEQAKLIAKKYFKRAIGLDEKQLKAKGLLIKDNPALKKYFSKRKISFYLKLGNISFIDLETKKKKKAEVLVIYGYFGEIYALYDVIKGKDIIFLFDNDCRDLSVDQLEHYIIHELTHGFQQYKDTSPEYDAEVEKITKGLEFDKRIYYTEPAELDAYLTQIGTAIINQFNSLKNEVANAEFAITNSKLSETKRVMEIRLKKKQDDLEKFLLELKNFIESPMKSYFLYKELPVPKTLAPFQDMLETIDEDEKLKNYFKKKMAMLYTKLKTPKS